MKFRTDFVTNSSDTSYISFNVKNQKLYDFIESLGIKIKSAGDGILSDRMEIILPSGMVGRDDGEAQLRSLASEGSISGWIMLCIQNFVLDDVDGLIEEQEEPDEDFDWDEACDEHLEAFNDELSELLSWDVINHASSMDDDIEYGTIRHEEGFEGTIFMSEEIDIRNGKRTVTTPRESLVYGEGLKEFDFSGTPGEVITQQLRNGQWYTVSKTILLSTRANDEDTSDALRVNDEGTVDPLAKLKDMNTEEAKEYLLELLASGEIDNDEFMTLYESIE